MTVTSAGQLSGVPYWYTGGTYHIVVEANNGVGPPAFQSFTLTVWDPPLVSEGSYDGTFRRAYFPPIAGDVDQAIFSQTDEDFADLVLGRPGTVVLRATGYPVPSWRTIGQLPPGMTLVDNGNGSATISGTPTHAGNYVVTIVAANSAGTSLGPVGSSDKLDLSVAPAVAPSFLSATSASEDTLAPLPCGEFASVASGFPAPYVTETGVLPNSEFLDDASHWDPGTAVIGTVGCNSKTGPSGTFPLAFAASNSAGSASQHVALTLVARSALNPVITSASSATFSADTYNAFLVGQSDGSIA
jgi:hypothetical protein